MNRNGIEPGDLHLLKLSAGCDSTETLESWQREREQQYGRRFHRTRMMPRRRDELLAGGSIYWVIKGFIQARQRILAFESLDLVKEDSEEVERHILLILDSELVRTDLNAVRPFQGWRYLKGIDAPKDWGTVAALNRANRPRGFEEMPQRLFEELSDLGLV